ncbi:MAG TPA: DUF6159 family protein [Rhizomicrobium sp.]
MFERTRRGLTVFRSSLLVLRAHPRLILLPVLSTASLVAAALLIFGSMSLGQDSRLAWLFVAIGWFGFLLAATFIAVFFNAALISCVLDAFAGRPVSLRAGLMSSVARLSPILQWAIYASTVGFAISFAQGLLRRFGILGALAGSAVSLSWSVATFFVVPILVAEGLQPRQAVARSTEIVKGRWGEAVGPAVGIGILGLLAFIPPILLLAYVNASDQLQVAHDRPLVMVGIVSAIYLAAVLGVISALSTVYRTAMYFSAKTGQSTLG